MYVLLFPHVGIGEHSLGRSAGDGPTSPNPARCRASGRRQIPYFRTEPKAGASPVQGHTPARLGCIEIGRRVNVGTGGLEVDLAKFQRSQFEGT